MSEQPPVIDVVGLVEGDDAALARVAREIVAPCADWGVFHVVGHGIPDAELRRFEAAMHRLFALPRETKRAMRRSRDNAWGWYDTELTKNRPDWKEVYDYGVERPGDDPGSSHSDGRNRWPPGDPGLRDALLAHYRHCERLGLALLRPLCLGLGTAPDALAACFARHTSFVRLNRYAPCPDAAPADAPLLPEAGRLGVHHHTDAGAVTILYQDEVAGLQVQHGGRLVGIDPLPGALTVHLADMLRVWSNDRYHSPVHRVVADPVRERYSAPFFLNPSYDAACAPLPALLADGEPPHYRPVSWGHFRDQRSAGDYADYGTEIQIDDFRIA